jgi:hypothetical protein
MVDLLAALGGVLHAEDLSCGAWRRNFGTTAANRKPETFMERLRTRAVCRRVSRANPRPGT